MLKSFKRLFSGRAVLLEMGAAIIFFGSLIDSRSLSEHAEGALRELKARGYATPDASSPVRAYPAVTSAAFSSSHAGGWRPGVISLRESSVGGVGPEVYLRHELAHEAGYRTCGGKLPLWAEEAAAMSFSGELSSLPELSMPTEEGLERLRRKVKDGASLDALSYSALGALVAAYGWPQKPCAASEKIAEILTGGDASGKEMSFSYVLMSIVSGRTLDSGGDLGAKRPPGSLLKIPFAASLEEAPAEEIGRALAKSDAEALLGWRERFNPDHYRLLLSMVKESRLDCPGSPEELKGKDEAHWRRYLGERDPKDGSFPLEADLVELAFMARASLLFKPEYFSELRVNGFIEGSTLYREAEGRKAVLSTLRAMCKTGTASDERGRPLVGHLMVVWPVESPAYLAVFRTVGGNGASNLRRASELLRSWSARFPPESGKVGIRLMSLTPRDSWRIVDACPTFDTEGSKGASRRISACGRFTILSSARGSRSERTVAGILESSPDGDKVVLETDPETYADAVLAAEAQGMGGEAEKALRAVIVWNGAHGRSRHAETSSLCDSTHCMVFRGSSSEDVVRKSATTDAGLLKKLDGIAADKRLEWLPFAKGGSEKWERFLSAEEVRKTVSETAVLDIRRERAGSGEVRVHLWYPQNEEVVSCEIFRSRLKLPSCPSSIVGDEGRGGWVFHGIGSGHGLGLSVERAKELARSGADAAAILRDAFE